MSTPTLTVQEFASRIKQKYPEYSNIADDELTQKILEKYPEYRSVVQVAQPERPRSIDEQAREQYAGGPAYQPFVDMAKGAAKGAVETVAYGAPGLVNRAIRAIPGADYLVPRYPEAPKELQPQGVGETLGNVLERAAEFMVPGGAIKRAGNVAEAATAARMAGAPRAAKALALGERAAIEGAANAAITSSQGGSDTEAGVVGAISAATPIGLKALESLRKYAPRLMNPILAPGMASFRFGRNPGQAVVDEGIVANSREQLLAKISFTRQKIGQAMDPVINNPTVAAQQINVQPLINGPIDDAMKAAAEMGERELVTKLNDLRKGLLTEWRVFGGKLQQTGKFKRVNLSPAEANKLKQNIGEKTRWTGEAFNSDLNDVRVKIYENLKEAIEQVAPEMKSLNSRWGNLLEAEKSLMRRNIIVERNLPVGLMDVTAGLGTAATSAASGGGGLESVIYGLAGTAGSKAIRSTPVLSRAAQYASHAGSGRVVRPARNVGLGAYLGWISQPQE